MAEAAPGHFTFGLGHLVRRDRVALERRALHRAVQAGAGHHRLPAGGPGRREGRHGLRHLRGPGLPAGPARVEHPPPIFLAALRPGMLRLAGRAADGVIINWLSADDVATVTPELGADIPVAARIFVIPSEDADMCRAIGRRMITAYLNVGVYAEFHRWLGRGEALERHVAPVEGGGPQGRPGRRARRGGRRPHRPRLLRRVPRPRSPATWPTASTSRCWPCCPSASTWPTPSRDSPRSSPGGARCRGVRSSRLSPGCTWPRPRRPCRAPGRPGWRCRCRARRPAGGRTGP